MLALYKTRQSARTPHEQSVLAAQIAATDRQLDRLVYALYGLSEEESNVVERVITHVDDRALERYNRDGGNRDDYCDA